MKQKVLEVTLPSLTPPQAKVVADNHRFKVLACGRRWGKTKMCVLIAVERAWRGGRVWWVAPTYAVSGIGWEMTKKLVMDKSFPLNKQIAIKEFDRSVTFPSGGSVTFKTAQEPENLRGQSLDLVIFDEADFVKETVWQDSIRPALSDKKGSAVFISTPFKENSWFHRMWKAGQENHPEIKSWQFSSYTNPYLDPAELDAAREFMSTLSFRREFMAEFVGAVGARIQRDWLQYYSTLPEKLDIVMGVDLAISMKQDADYTAACVLGRAKDGIIYLLALERIRASFGEQQIFIKQLADKYKPRVVAIEQVGYQDSMVQQMQATTKLNIRGIKVTKDKISRFAPLEARFEHGQVYLSKDLPLYVESELLEFPIGEHDDTIDSISIAWEALGPQQNVIATPAYDIREDVGWRC